MYERGHALAAYKLDVPATDSHRGPKTSSSATALQDGLEATRILLVGGSRHGGSPIRLGFIPKDHQDIVP